MIASPPESGLILIRDVPVGEVQPSPENEKLYRPVAPTDPDVIQLADSIREHGIIEPLVITQDRFILSGHRRYMAARMAGLAELPVRIEPICRRQEPDRFLRLLREYNRHREKSLDEKLREAVVSADPDEAYASLIEHRKEQSRQRIDSLELDLDADEKRARITKAKAPLLVAVRNVIARLEDFWPLTVRQIHYQLLNDPPLLHASKPDSRYQNVARCYKSLDEFLVRARLQQLIPWDAIHDPTRPVTTWDIHRDPSTFIEHELDRMFTGYWRDLMQSQPVHLEIVAEKNTVRPIIEPVASKYCVPVTTGRGFCSLPPRKEMVRRFKASGRDRMAVIIVSDFDPEGEMIAHSFVRSIRRDFHITNVDAIKAALTHEHVERFHLARAFAEQAAAKEGSTNRDWFVRKYGDDVYELEALAPTDLQQLLADAIDSVIDVQAFNHELDREREDAAFLETARRRAQAALSGIMEGGVG